MSKTSTGFAWLSDEGWRDNWERMVAEAPENIGNPDSNVSLRVAEVFPEDNDKRPERPLEPLPSREPTYLKLKGSLTDDENIY